MEELHITAKTLEEAITEACVKLSVTSDCLEYTIDVHGTNGFFGIGARPFEITARVKKSENVKPAVKKSDKPSKKEIDLKKDFVADVNSDIKAVQSASAPSHVVKEEEKSALKSYVKPAVAEPIPKKDESRVNLKAVPKNEERKNFTNKIPKSKDVSSREKDNKESDSSLIARANRKERHKPDIQKTDNVRRTVRKDNISKQSVSANAVPEAEKKPFVLLEDPSERAKSFLDCLFKGMDMKIVYSGSYDEGSRSLTINLSGDDMGVLIGKRGQTLDALQYLTSQVVNKHQNGYIRVKIDTENYRERRKETLEQFALNMAGRVRKNNRPIVLEPMNAYERRIIHSCLQSEKDIITRSEGEEPYRHIVICPVKKRRNIKPSVNE